MTLGWALLIAVALYLIDKHNRWKDLWKATKYLCSVALGGAVAWFAVRFAEKYQLGTRAVHLVVEHPLPLLFLFLAYMAFRPVRRDTSEAWSDRSEAGFRWFMGLGRRQTEHSAVVQAK